MKIYNPFLLSGKFFVALCCLWALLTATPVFAFTNTSIYTISCAGGSTVSNCQLQAGSTITITGIGFQNSNPSLTIAGLPLQLLSVNNNEIKATMPTDAPTGSQTLAITLNGNTTNVPVNVTPAQQQYSQSSYSQGYSQSSYTNQYSQSSYGTNNAQSSLDCSTLGLVPDPTGSGLCMPEEAVQRRAGTLAGSNTIGSLIRNILYILLTLTGVIAVLFLVIGAVMYMTAAGNEKQAEKGKSTMKVAVFGLIVAVLAYTIVTIVFNLLTQNSLF